MTNIIPRIGATTLGTVVLRPLPDVEPFSIRSGYSFEGILSDIRTWLRDELVPYLEDTSAEAIFQENVDKMIDTVNAALATQSQVVVDALNDAVNQVITASIPVSNALIRAVFESMTTDTVFYAPMPSGGDDTAGVQAAVNRAQAANGTVRLHRGHYRFNVATAQSFVQPRIVGAGKQYTFVSAFDPTKPVLKFQGGSGSASGGYFADFSSEGTGTAVVELADVCDVTWDRVHFDGSYQVGLLFHVTQAQGFTEFCRGEATFTTSLALAIEYRSDNTAQTSFHGSGLVGGIVDFAGAAAVRIGNYCYPYNAPMTATFFSHAPDTVVFDLQWAGAKCWFFGVLTFENQSNGVTVLAKSADINTQVLFLGPVGINTANTYFGKLYRVKKVYATASRTFVEYEPWQRYIGVIAGSNRFDLFLRNGESTLVNLNVVGPDYLAQYQLIVWQNPLNPGGTVGVLSGGAINNGSGIGEMQFSVDNYQLVVKNDSLSPQYNMSASIMHLGGDIGSDSGRQ